MKIAIFCRKAGRMALTTATYFRAHGMDVSLFVVEVGVRKKLSPTERQFKAAHQEFRRHLVRRSTLKARIKLLARAVFDGLPIACQELMRPSVLRGARKMGIPAFVVQRHSSRETRDILEGNEVSHVLLTSSAWLIKEPLLSMETKIINAHCAKLPEHRSLDALPWSVLEDEPIGLTAHFVDQGRMTLKGRGYRPCYRVQR